ncbi:restriction endonuclease [Mycobacteroides abscessus subsp. abscessus]|nr:restriction endonuclease [Mycobacteroides abscessus subsp. abscessus]
MEAVVGVLLCSRFPNAVRVRPSQRDGGIDIFVPGPASWGKERAVWQIKRYCHNLTGTENVRSRDHSRA